MYSNTLPGAGLPVCVVRPSIVGSTWKQPIAGWVDGYNGEYSIVWSLCTLLSSYSGVVGVCYCVGSGAARVMPGDISSKADIIPVDTAVWCGVCILTHQCLY